jgi:hypothetical protein
METVLNILSDLVRIAVAQRNGAILFAYQFKDMVIRGVFFGRPKTLTIGISDRNVGWQCDLSNGHLSEQIPKEAYRVIKDALKEGDSYSNKPFFLELKAALSNIASSSEVRSPTDEDIRFLLHNCKTQDKKYDQDGDKPFFDHWRRVRPSSESLKKIQRYFGYQVREECFRNKVTAVWSAEPKEKSFYFLNPDIVVGEVLAAANLLHR